MSTITSEWRIVSRDPILRWIAAILLLLTLLALWNGAQFAERRAGEADAEVTRALDKRAADRATLIREAADPTIVNPWGASEPTRADWNAARPPGPLAALSFGREDIEPLSANVSLWMVRTDNLFRKYEFGSPVALAAGRFDAGFFVVLLLPLLLLALGYNVVAEERESGRLRIAQVQGRQAGRRLFARLLLRQSPVYATVVLIALWSFVVLGPSLRLVAWTVTGLVYLLFWSGTTAIIASARGRQEMLALLAAAVWLILVVLLPAGSATLARIVAPTPSQFELINGSRTASLEANRNLLKNLQGYISDHPELMSGGTTSDDWAAKLYVSQLVIEDGLAPVMLAHRAVEADQMRWSEALRFLSPAIAADHAMTETAGTSRFRQEAYFEQVTRFLHGWRDTLSPKVFRRERMRPGDIDDLPRFEFMEPASRATSILASLLFVGLLAVATLWLGIRRLTRLEN